MIKRKEIIGDSGLIHIDTYNEENPDKKLPHLFIIFDEADTILKRDSSAGAISSSARSLVEEIAAECRTSGIHMIIASQKPERRNIDTTIKTNIPDRLALRVASATDSRVILDQKGAEKLTGEGDALLKIQNSDRDPVKRIQCAYTTLAERKEAIRMLKNNG